jgi:hypothetical protein
MKRILLYTMMAFVTLAACNKESNDVFDKTPNERMAEKLAAYQAALQAAQYGWNAELTTESGAIYNFHFSFNDAARVKTFADIDTGTASLEKESSYRLKALQQPALLFDTYTYLHVLADPDGSVNGGDNGIGLATDFEFSLDTLATDSIKLTGRQHGTKMTLRRSSQADYQAWTGGVWRSSVLFQSTATYIQNYFKRLTVGAKQYEMRINPAARTVTFIWLDGVTTKTHTTSYYFTATGVEFTRPLVDGTTTINYLSNLNWNSALVSFQLSVNGATAASISGAIAPISNDVNAPQRWWQTMVNSDGYWRSINGFHVNGVDDAYKVRSIPNFYFLAFLPRFGVDGGVTYDLAGYVMLENGGLALNFGSAFSPPVFANGKVWFDYIGDLGDLPADMDPYIATTLQFWSATGFYLVQTGPTSYDMVSASDAKAWISWF